MPNINNIIKTMKKKKTNIPQDILVQFGDDRVDYKREYELLLKLNDLLNTEQKYVVMEQQGCCKGGKRDKESKDFGKQHADKSLADKLKILSAGNKAPCANDDGTMCYAMPSDKDAPHLNADGTLSYAVRCYVDDITRIFESCHCLRNGDYAAEFSDLVKENPDKAHAFMQFFCGCCAGHQKHHLQNRLGVSLKLKSVNISSVKTEKGSKRVFVYEIVETR